VLDIRFPTALQLMLSLAYAAEQDAGLLSSGQLALSLGTNPSLVRKLLAPLERDGLVASMMGKNGGVRLNRPAAEITLHQIYRSVIADKRVWQERTDVPHRCLVSTHAQRHFMELAEEAERAVADALTRRTLEQSLRELQQYEDKREVRSSRKRA
jgi:Rrf2 family transcriptional repressor of oqxAB